MKLVEKFKKSRLSGQLGKFPNTHVFAVGILTVILGTVSITSGEKAQASRQVGTLSLPAPESSAALPNNDNPAHSPIEFLAEPDLEKISLTVQSGENLSVLFKRAGLSDRDMMNFIARAEQSRKLESIKPQHRLEFYLDDEKHIHQLTYRSNKLSSFSYSLKDGSTYEFKEELRKPDVKRASRSGTIKSSLYLAGQNANMDDKLILAFAEIFGWDIDFALDIRAGDRFRVLYEELFLDGEKLGNGAILSAEFINQKQSFKAVRYVHQDGRVEYYTPEGKNMRKAFLRAPLDFRRISSSFNPRRLHPITKTVKPHRGIDYAAKTGTPIWSSGDGKVISSGYSKYNGNYVVIQHGNNIQTKYLHLAKRKVKKGQRVRQKQIIGTVGSTGLSTAPHLHYEFLLNGVHRNPRTIVQKLPKAESIPSHLQQDFLFQTEALLAELIGEAHVEFARSDAVIVPSS